MTRNAPRYLQSKTHIAASYILCQEEESLQCWVSLFAFWRQHSLSETVVWSINYVIQKVASFKVEPEKNKNKVEPGAEMYSLAGPDYDASSFTSSVR